jgi:hypothetical protein
MSLCRLLDPAGKRGQENVSLRNLVQLVDHDTATQHVAAVQSAYTQLLADGKVLRAYRNKRIGHNDLLVARGTLGIPTVSVNEITKVIRGVARLMSVISSH